MKRVILVVIDSLGVGYMDDVIKVRPEDLGANTFYNILNCVDNLSIPTLELLGINSILKHPNLKEKKPLASYGTINLQHMGADSYAGHQEIMGTYPKVPNIAPFSECISEVKEALVQKGYNVVVPDKKMPYLLVENYIVIADNIETDYGQIYNITAPLDYIPFEKVMEIGQLVRSTVKVSRVIALGGKEITIDNIIDSIERRKDGLVGVNSPKSGVYNKGYNVRHLGFGVDHKTQVSSILIQNGKRVVLIGKMQDVINSSKAMKKPAVDTNLVMEEILQSMEENKEGLIAATVQETDLAGHSEDPNKYADKIMIVDKYLAKIMEKMTENDMLIITADHGNDPTIGNSQHTRERTPLLVYRRGGLSIDLGLRDSLSDIASTISEYFDVIRPQNGTSFLSALGVVSKGVEDINP